MPNLAGLLHEVDNWESAWLTLPYECLPNTVTETLQMTNNIAFPTISTVLKSLGVLPITSCSYERSASSIRILNTYLRSTMTQERLNGLVTLYTQKDIGLDLESIITSFARKHKRRLKLLTILASDEMVPESDDIVTSEVY